MYKALIIDDDPAMTDLLKMMLEPSCMEIKCVNDGASGLSALYAFHPDIVILDLLMPDLDGWKVCRILKEKYDFPILVLSAVDNPQRISDALSAGADDYLIKPVSKDVLLAHINKLIRRNELKQSAIKRNSVNLPS